MKGFVLDYIARLVLKLQNVMRISMDYNCVITISVRQCDNEVKDGTIEQNVEYNDSFANISLSFYKL